ncbi:serine/threonine protein phosphatase 1 [Rhizobium petrolearium]|uniref:metallophosphoesterase family protein n=1 Tax=Neorhizobium petrolearium TaxID=515361 RepID=UPI001AE647B5|nr:metallophosphoesterase family protein [Neorhizobium petrolearium]MBP1843497.1 serine/threonine protein phosphatase 1 [Neorhizobium petrolearium]
MRKFIDWFSRRGAESPSSPKRRRIDLGSTSPSYPIYVIGDVHGCVDELKAAETRIIADMQATKRTGLVILLGDYVDRGPSSRHVLEHLIRPSELGLKRLPLCGNHDDIFAKFLREPELYSDWLSLGGEQTLISYGIDLHHLRARGRGRSAELSDLLAEAIPASHRQFLADLPVCLSIGELLFVHAGIRPGIPLDEQHDEDMLWIREPFLTEGPRLPLLVVHGHTPQPDLDLGPGRIGIDTGAYYTGKLTILKIDEGRATVL